MSNDDLSRHELTCPVNVQVQQFLQQQQQSQLQNQLQNNQFQQQFQQSYQQQHNSFMPSSYTSAQNVMPPLQMQQIPRSLNLLSQQPNFSMEHNQSGQQVTSSPPDDFEAAVANLPAFKPPSKPLDPNSADYFPLSCPEDDEWLTPLHCFVRQYCVEIFVATPADVAAPCMGKRNPVLVGQVGIRCPYCCPERMRGKISEVDIARARENGVVYPSLISRIYNATINLLQRHLRTCAYVPPEILARYDDLKKSNARSGASKKYWTESAFKLGLVDSPQGIRLDKNVYLKAKRDMEEAPRGHEDDSQAPIVLPSDKRYTTSFTYFAMSQLQPCAFTEADRLGRRRGLEVGYAGLACRHCAGGYGSGRFFPSSVKTMSDASKTLDVVFKHICKCKKCPPSVKKTLLDLRRAHESERAKMPFGNQRAFFTKIWMRLHENDSVSGSVALPPAVAAPTASVPMAMPPLELDSSSKSEERRETLAHQMMASINRSNSVQNKVVSESA